MRFAMTTNSMERNIESARQSNPMHSA